MVTPIASGRLLRSLTTRSDAALERAVAYRRRTSSAAASRGPAAAAGPRDAAADEVLRRYENARSKAASDLVVKLRSRRPLAVAVTTRRASDVVYGLLSPQFHALMVQERGWSPKRFAGWAADAIGRALWG